MPKTCVCIHIVYRRKIANTLAVCVSVCVLCAGIRITQNSAIRTHSPMPISMMPAHCVMCNGTKVEAINDTVRPLVNWIWCSMANYIDIHVCSTVSCMHVRVKARDASLWVSCERSHKKCLLHTLPTGYWRQSHSHSIARNVVEQHDTPTTIIALYSSSGRRTVAMLYIAFHRNEQLIWPCLCQFDLWRVSLFWLERHWDRIIIITIISDYPSHNNL